MPPQQHLYNGLASPADYSILHGRVHVGTGMDSPARTACWPTAIMAGLRPSYWPAATMLAYILLAYGQRGSRCGRADVVKGDIGTDTGTDKVKHTVLVEVYRAGA